MTRKDVEETLSKLLHCDVRVKGERLDFARDSPSYSYVLHVTSELNGVTKHAIVCAYGRHFTKVWDVTGLRIGSRADYGTSAWEKGRAHRPITHSPLPKSRVAEILIQAYRDRGQPGSRAWDELRSLLWQDAPVAAT